MDGPPQRRRDDSRDRFRHHWGTRVPRQAARCGISFVAAALHTAAGFAALAAALPARAEMEETSLVGAGGRTRPAYDGADGRIREPVPVLRYFGAPWFVRTSQGILEGGVRQQLQLGLHVGVALAYEQGREASEAPLLAQHRVPDIAYGTSAGPFLEWDSSLGPVPITVLARVRQDTRLNHGAQADVRANAGVFRGGPVEAVVFAQSTWASNRSNARLYGIDPAEAAETGLLPFHAGAGWQVASAGLLASLNVLRPWEFVGTAERHWLMGSVVQSPLVQRSGAFYASLGLAYRF